MYPNFIEDRKSLDYEVLNDTSCGIKLMQITDSTVLLIRNLPLNVNQKSHSCDCFSKQSLGFQS